MKITSWTGPESTTIKIEDNLNRADMAGLRQEIMSAAGAREIRIDLSAVEFIDHGFVNLMADLKEKHPGLHRRIKVVNPGPFVIDVLKRVYLDKIDEVFQKEEP